MEVPRKKRQLYKINCAYCGVEFGLSKDQSRRLEQGSIQIACGLDCSKRPLNNPEPEIKLICCEDCGGEFCSDNRRFKRCTNCREKRYRVNKSKARLNRRQAFKNQYVEPVDILVLAKRDKNICGFCKKKVNMKRKGCDRLAPSIDHKTPLAHGGEHSYKNTRLAHFGCNSGQGRRIARQGAA